MLAFTILLENGPQHFLDSLPSVYLVGNGAKKTMDNKHILTKITDYYSLNTCLTPSELYEHASRNFLTGGYFKYYSSVVCARGAASSGCIDIVRSAMKRGGSNVDCIASKSARNGHLDILLLALDSGAVSYTHLTLPTTPYV